MHPPRFGVSPGERQGDDMFEVPQALEKFIASLELTDAQADRVNHQHIELREKLRKQLSPSEPEFLSGSYSRNTAIRPLNDIDIFVVLPTSSEGPHAVLLRVRDAL